VTKHDAHAARSIEQRTISRKTPGDGKLEITKIAAGRLESLGGAFAVRVNDADGRAKLGEMPCTCRGKDVPHVHYFVESDLFRSLVPGSTVELLVDDATPRLLVVPA
jgi:hypothetical protein